MELILYIFGWTCLGKQCRPRPCCSWWSSLIRVLLTEQSDQSLHCLPLLLHLLHIWAASWQNQQSECAPSEDSEISLGIRPVWSESLLCAQWVAKYPQFLHAESEDSDQTGQMPRLIWVFSGCTLTLLVLSCDSCHGSFVILMVKLHYSNFRIFTAIFSGAQIFKTFTVYLTCS